MDPISIDLSKILDFVLNKQVIGTILILIGGSIITSITKKVIRKLFAHQFKHFDQRRQKTLESILINVSKYAIWSILLLMLLDLYGIDIKALLSSLGIVGLFVGLALQDTAKDFIAGFSIIFEDQYRVGDSVTIGDFRGEVKALGLKTTVLKKFNGDLKSISNRNITEVINHSREATVEQVSIPVSYKADLQYVNSLLNDLCEKLSNELENLEEPIKNIGLNSFDPTNATFLISFQTKPLQHMDIKRTILREVKELFDKEGIEIPLNPLNQVVK